MKDSYFIEIGNLYDEALLDEVFLSELGKAVAPWIPTPSDSSIIFVDSLGPTHSCNYILIDQKTIYLAIVYGTPGAFRLRSVKGFKARDIMAYALMVSPDPAKNEEPMPQLRLMLTEGKRIKLMLADVEGNRTALQRLARAKFLQQ